MAPSQFNILKGKEMLEYVIKFSTSIGDFINILREKKLKYVINLVPI